MKRKPPSCMALIIYSFMAFVTFAWLVLVFGGSSNP